ncbi:MAG: hypothetical protein GXP49_04050, partial [Deltaproteobacteria bacterium]|nr:hypothetical protein [Deltaproteobacteria bacterium]
TDTDTDTDTGDVCPSDPNRLACGVDDDCDPGWWCEEGCCQKIVTCSGNTDCKDLGSDYECRNGVCQIALCGGNDECPGGQICSGGKCVDAPQCNVVTAVRITTAAGAVTEGKTKAFSAQALNKNGAVLPGFLFKWSSSDTDVASIDEETGVATGGNKSGTTDIVAKLACNDTVASDAVVLTNYSAVASADTRVLLFDSATGAPIEGATVKADDQEQVTDATGAALFTGLNASTVSVFKQGYPYLTAMNVTKNDLVFYTKPFPDPNKAGGVKGDFDFSKFITKSEIEIGMAGLSIAGDLTNLDFTSLIGEMIQTHIDLGAIYNDNVPLPSGLHIGFSGNTFKKGFEVEGEDGSRVLWGFGGYLPLQDLLDIVSPIIDKCSNQCDYGAVIGENLPKLMPYIYKFQHGILTGLDVKAIPKVADVNDLNGNGKTDDMIADFDNFPTVGPLVLDTPMRQDLELSIPKLPSYNDSPMEAAVVLAGALPPEGLVILGLGAGTDKRSDDDTPDQMVGEKSDGKITIKLSPEHGGIEGSPYVVATLVTKLDFSSGADIPISGRLDIMDKLPADAKLDVSNFLGWVENATFDAGSRTFSGKQVDGASMYRMTLMADNVQWQVYVPKGNPSFNLPAVPNGFADIGDKPTVSVEAWETNGDMGVDQLFEFNDTNMDSLVKDIKAFSVLVLGGQGGGGCSLTSNCSATGASYPGIFGWALFLGLFAIATKRRG